MNDQPGTTSLKGKVAVVTGGTRGIGRSIAERLLHEGVRVAVCGSRQQSVDDAIAAMSAQGDVFGFTADVSKRDDVKNFIASVKERFGTIHILINNAGVGSFRDTASLGPEDWDRMIGVNLSGAYYCSHEVLPIFLSDGNRERGGDVINIGSLAGKNPFAGGSGYNASKFGLLGFSEAMMLDHRNSGVRVSCIMPGSVDTGFSNSGGSDSEWKIAPSDIAEVVVALLQMPRRTTISRVEMRPSRPATTKTTDGAVKGA